MGKREVLRFRFYVTPLLSHKDSVGSTNSNKSCANEFAPTKPAHNSMIGVPNTSFSMPLYFMFDIHREQGNLNLFNTLMELPVIFMGQQ